MTMATFEKGLKAFRKGKWVYRLFEEKQDFPFNLLFGSFVTRRMSMIKNQNTNHIRQDWSGEFTQEDKKATDWVVEE